MFFRILKDIVFEDFIGFFLVMVWWGFGNVIVIIGFLKY